MPIRFRTYNGRRRGYAMTLVCLMILLPWCSMATSGTEFYGSSDDTSQQRSATSRSWGVNGTNDTGWIDLASGGADPANGTPAYGDLMLEFAPGAVINNLTFEIAVNGSDGYWANQPQLTLMNTQTEILDWGGMGDLGRQNDFFDHPQP